MAAAAARLRKGALLDAARRALREPSLVAVGALLKADVPAVRAARDAYRARGIRVKKLPNRLCRLAVADTDRAFLAGLFAGDYGGTYPNHRRVEWMMLRYETVNAAQVERWRLPGNGPGLVNAQGVFIPDVEGGGGNQPSTHSVPYLPFRYQMLPWFLSAVERGRDGAQLAGMFERDADDEGAARGREMPPP